MLSPVLLVIGLYITYGLTQQLGAFNFRHYCTGQHSSSKYKVSCDGSKHFKDKNLFLDGRSVFGITHIELYSFDSINILSQSLSDWDKIRNITIRNSKNVVLNVKSILKLNKFEIDSVDELTFETVQPSSGVNIQKMLISNVGKLNMSSSKNVEIKAGILILNNIKDVNLIGQLQFLGGKLTVSASNIDVTDHSMVILKFPEIIVKESSKLYIQEGGQSEICTDNLLLSESYIYIDGHINISSCESLGNKSQIKFLKNSFYGMSQSHLEIVGNRSEIEFTENGIYSSDIGDVLELVGETEGVTFTNNTFGCNKCAKKQMIKAKYLQYLGEQNFCDLTCNLTLNRYKELLDQEKICHQGEFNVDDQILCSVTSEPAHTTRSLNVFWWALILFAIILSLALLSILLFFFCKRHKTRFQSMPVGNAIVLPAELKDIQVNQKLILRAFTNDIYERIDNHVENIYEIVDPPRSTIYMS